jgi:hypothetical protein
MASLSVLILSILLPLLPACSWAVAAVGPSLLSPFPPALARLAVHCITPYILFACGIILYISRQFCRWRRRRPPAGPKRDKTGKPSHFVLRVFVALLRAWFTLMCLALVTRASHTLLFGASSPSHMIFGAPQTSLLVNRNVLAKPDSHEHHSHTRLRSSCGLDCLLDVAFVLYQGINSSSAVMNYPVNTTETAFTHRPLVDQHFAESASPSLCSFAHGLRSRNFVTHTCRKAHPYANINFFPPCNAYHQPVTTLLLSAAHTHSPDQWAHHPPAGCTALPKHTFGIGHVNPVAASLRLLTAEHRFIGVIPILRRTAKELQHNLRTAKAGWATPAATSARWAWTALVDYSVQLGRVHATAALGQVCDPAPVSDIAFAHMSGEAAVGARILSDLFLNCCALVHVVCAVSNVGLRDVPVDSHSLSVGYGVCRTVALVDPLGHGSRSGHGRCHG